MMSAMLIAGIGAIVAGLVAVAYGFSLKEFSFGNTMIFIGAMGACTGMVMIGLSMVVGELKNIARRLPPRSPAEPRTGTGARPVLPPPSAALARAPEGGFLFSRDEPAAAETDEIEPVAPPIPQMPPLPPMPPIPPVPSIPSPIPWQDENGARERARPALAPISEPAAEAVPAPSPKSPRNPLFSSRRERDRLPPRPSEAAVAEPVRAPSAEIGKLQPSPFDDAWPRAERPQLRRSGRAAPAFKEALAADQPTVVKSGAVDGMAYSLFSDGSIEAQMPEGMMRFGSIEELRAHLEQRS
ncbi:DUF308 domain-containing protein [Bradyrhizobium sp.]|uniref:DUF308 domain-containing protein n=1 Tax=Bradyrhizobium sp. TaxID=376 RepID=UPI001DE3816B|nr:DUF308 domain-containing protein [Bradyrhizobium sp.]MBV8696953.1 DUF308 domain-containing protein [Bradyrhizobium sp.]MBV8921762.1 DUF308 domain-containing protein [Bradyrhizobium sp.]